MEKRRKTHTHRCTNQPKDRYFKPITELLWLRPRKSQTSSSSLALFWIKETSTVSACQRVLTDKDKTDAHTDLDLDTVTALPLLCWDNRKFCNTSTPNKTECMHAHYYYFCIRAGTPTAWVYQDVSVSTGSFWTFWTHSTICDNNTNWDNSGHNVHDIHIYRSLDLYLNVRVSTHTHALSVVRVRSHPPAAGPVWRRETPGCRRSAWSSESWEHRRFKVFQAKALFHSYY